MCIPRQEMVALLRWMCCLNQAGGRTDHSGLWHWNAQDLTVAVESVFGFRSSGSTINRPQETRFPSNSADVEPGAFHSGIKSSTQEGARPEKVSDDTIW